MKNKFEQLWIVKYKPRKIEDILGNLISKKLLKHLINSDLFFHIILVGPSGSGKKTAFFSMLTEKYNINFYKEILYINIYDYITYGFKYLIENKYIPISIKRQCNPLDSLLFNFKKVIKNYCSLSLINRNQFKIIFFDWAEYLTIDMQYSLRRILEKNSYFCSFIFSTRNLIKLMNPIKSRCFILYFNYISKNELLNLITDILHSEKIKYNINFLEYIIYKSNGNIEKSLLITQRFSLDINSFENTPFISCIQEKNYIPYFLNILKQDSIDYIYNKLDKLIIEKNLSLKKIISDLINEINSQLFNTNIKYNQHWIQKLTKIIIFLGDYEDYSNKIIADELELIKFSIKFKNLIDKN